MSLAMAACAGGKDHYIRIPVGFRQLGHGTGFDIGHHRDSAPVPDIIGMVGIADDVSGRGPAQGSEFGHLQGDLSVSAHNGNSQFTGVGHTRNNGPGGGVRSTQHPPDLCGLRNISWRVRRVRG